MAKKIKKARKIKKVKEYKEGKLVVIAPWKGTLLRNLIVGTTLLILSVTLILFVGTPNFLVGLGKIMFFAASLPISLLLLFRSRLKVFDDRIELPASMFSYRVDLCVLFLSEVKHVEILKLSDNYKVPVFYMKNGSSVRLSKGDTGEEKVLFLLIETLKENGIVPTDRDLSTYSYTEKRKIMRSHDIIVRRSVK